MTSSHAANFDLPTPTHRAHAPEQPLPTHADRTTDYSTETMEHTLNETKPAHNTARSDNLAQNRSTEGANAFNSERPLDVKPTPQGNVAIGGDPNLPEGHATMMDKVVGKTQKVIGKMTHNAEKHERGELRESGGKAAAMGAAQAPHD